MDFTIKRLDFKAGVIRCVNCEYPDLDPDTDPTKWTRNAQGLPIMAAVTCPSCRAITSFRLTD